MKETKREIKFRQKTINGNGNKTFHYWGFMGNGEFILPLKSSNETFHTAKDNSEQLTGLHDRNGKEIYERDIVKDFEMDSETFCIREVRWGAPRYAGFYFYSGDTPTEKLFDLVCEKDIEIIGNIYENENLLKS